VPSWKTVVRVAKSCVRERIQQKPRTKKHIMERKAQKEKGKEKKVIETCKA
jgi:hypothetical protein